jgi:hypothetical protein
VTPDTAELILRSLTELRDEVREGLRNLNLIVTGIDARLRDLELWRASQTSAENVVQQALDHEHNERGLVLSSKQVNAALGSVVISALAFTASVIALIFTS